MVCIGSDFFHLASDSKLNSIIYSILSKSDSIFIRNQITSIGSIQSSSNLFVDIWFHRNYFISVQYLQALDSILVAAFEEFFQNLLFFRSSCKNQGTIALVAKVKLLIELGKHLIARPAELGTHTSRFVVESSMDNSAVTLGGALSYIISSFQEKNRGSILTEFSSNSTTNATSTDDNYIVRPIAFLGAPFGTGTRACLTFVVTVIRRTLQLFHMLSALFNRHPFASEINTLNTVLTRLS
mmetsp:Transcript_123123/g.241522  ORF Transcript_123123/g.241522 Transcript_123123/m.241522 type:complete len:240 (-) Transcript_123123:28-747(-)